MCDIVWASSPEKIEIGSEVLYGMAEHQYLSEEGKLLKFTRYFNCDGHFNTGNVVTVKF